MKKVICIVLIVCLLSLTACGHQNMIQYQGVWYPKSELSRETLDWLEWYNSLSERDQMAISFRPPDITKLMDADVTVVETAKP